MKKAIVLLITLALLSIISTLIVVSLNISTKNLDRVAYIDAQNQFSLVFKDFVKIIKNFSKDINDSQTLDMFLSNSTLPGLYDEKSGITIGMMVETKMDRINLNYLLNQLVQNSKNGDVNLTSEFLLTPLEKFSAFYRLSDSALFIDLLLDTIDQDQEERAPFSEISALDFDFREGKVFSFNHLKKIFNHYYKLSHDERIFAITENDFDRFFYFGDTKKYGLLDCNRVSSEVMKLLIRDDFDMQDSDYCTLFKDPPDELKKIKKIYNITDFDKNSKYLVECQVILNTDEFNQTVSFDFDINSARIESIDKNTKE